MRLLLVALTMALSCTPLLAQDAPAVPFVIPAEMSPDSPIGYKLPAVAADGPRVVAKDGKFYAGNERFKVWGVNTCFAGDLPTHDSARLTARRMAWAGVNCVRIHHLDTADFPRGIWDPKKPAEFSAEALDRLDFFINELAQAGIRVNLNLHVGRSHSSILKLPAAPESMDKMVDIFTPQLIEAQRKYARDLLGRVNAYRKVRYADDAAISFIEITNEDSLFMWNAARVLPALPPFYADILQKKYAQFLQGRYGSTEKLRQSWSAGASPLGESMLGELRLSAEKPGERFWNVEVHAPAAAKARMIKSDGRDAVRIEIGKTDGADWHLQFNQSRLAVKAGQYYTVRFAARADKPRGLSYAVGQAHDPWKPLSAFAGARLDAQWRTFEGGFVAAADDDNARLSFVIGESDVAVELRDVELRPGGRQGLREDETIEKANIAVFPPSATPQRDLDRVAFLMQTEKDFFDAMYTFIKKDLGCKALVTGTIVFGPAGLYGQSGMDYIDGHAYWQHPQFPGRPWDVANWLVQQKAMVLSPAESPLFSLACDRLLGKPFTVSEYNHPAPNDYQAECVPMVAAFAAAQDWDGVWMFDYNSSEKTPGYDAIDGFFDIHSNPAKWGFMPAGAAIFRQGAVPPLAKAHVTTLSSGASVLDDLAALALGHYDLRSTVRDIGKLDWPDMLAQRTYVSLAKGAQAPKESGKLDRLFWSDGKDGIDCLELDGGVRLRVGKPQAAIARTPQMLLSAPAFAAVTVTPMDGKELKDSKKVLVTACGRCENTGMKFSADRRTVGRDWGKGPACIEPVTADIAVPGVNWTCMALAPNGAPVAEVPLKGGRLQLSPSAETMWYLLTRP